MFARPDRFLSYVLSTLGQFFVSSQPVLCRAHTQTRIVLFHDLRISTPNLELFPNCVLKELSRIAFPIIVLPEDDRTDFAQEERLDLPCWTMIWAICVLVDVSKYPGHSDFGIFNNDGASSFLTWVKADTASAACPVHPGSLDMTSVTFAAVICDADEPCSVNTA